MSVKDGVISRIEDSSDDVLLPLLENMIWPVLAFVALIILVVVPQTFQWATLSFMLYTMVPLGLIVLAESVCLLSGHFDLSVGAIAGFSAVFTGMIFSEWGLTSSPLVGFFVIIAVGCMIGFINGFSIAKLGVNPFLQTLAFFIIFGGGKLALTTRPIFEGIPDLYLFPGNEENIAMAILIVSFVGMAAILHYTEFGRAVYAVGSDKEAARAVGINTDRVVIAVYTISGFFCALAGLMFTGFIGGIPVDIADGMVFPAFAAAIIGGISLFGGRGKLLGAFGGVILLQLIETALDVGGVDPTVIEVINGVVLLIAILLYTTKEKIRNQILAGEVA